jgi:universal stress protein A
MVYPHKILVTTDLSRYSLAGVDYAALLGARHAASTLYLLHVVEHVQQGRTESDAMRSLRVFVEREWGSGGPFTLAVRFGSPAAEIRRFAVEEGVDLIIIATHGRTGLRHIMIGSVAEKIVRHSPIPVMTVKPVPLRDVILEEDDVESELHLR